MAAWQAVPGATFLRTTGLKHHLHIVLKAGCAVPNCGKLPHAVYVNITTIRPPPTYHDPTCVLQPGEHPFVIAPSYVFYKQICSEDEAHLNNTVSSSGLARDPLDPVVLKRMINGVCLSSWTPNLFSMLFGCSP